MGHVIIRACPPAWHFEFRRLVESDLEFFQEWLQRPHVKTWWSSPATVEALRDEYLPAVTHGAARPFLACLDGNPVGFIQYYVVSEGGQAWWSDVAPAGTVGIDQFLADGARLGQGLGTAMVKQFAGQLFLDPDVMQIRVDPSPENVTAIRCYLKAGFRQAEPFTSPDGPALLMVLDRPVVAGA